MKNRISKLYKRCSEREENDMTKEEITKVREMIKQLKEGQVLKLKLEDKKHEKK